MKNIISYILEHRTKDEVKIYYGNKEITPKRYIFDKESLDDFINYYKKNKTSEDFSNIRLCHMNNGVWKVLKGVCSISEYNMNEFIKKFNKIYKYDEFVELLENQNYLLILI